MKRWIRKWALPWLATTVLTFLGRGALASDALPVSVNRSAFDLEGHSVNPLEFTNFATVLIFVGIDCPISNKYSPEIHRLRSLFENQGVAFWMIYPDSDARPDEIRKHARAFDLGNKILRDPNHFLVKMAQATVTPQAAIFDRNRDLVYCGRIDDRYVALGKERIQATRKDLEINLNLLVKGEPIVQKRTKSIGCQIPDLN